MKSFIALALFCFVAVGTVQAQAVNQLSSQKTEQTSQIDALSTQLGLTVQQKADVEKTLTSFKSTIDRINKSTMSAADKATKIEAVTNRMNSNLQTYMSKEQYAKYEKIKNTPSKKF